MILIGYSLTLTCEPAFLFAICANTSSSHKSWSLNRATPVSRNSASFCISKVQRSEPDLSHSVKVDSTGVL